MACDRCKKVGVEVLEVRSDFQTARVKHICHDCRRAAENYIWSLRSVTDRWLARKMKKFMARPATLISRVRAALSA